MELLKLTLFLHVYFEKCYICTPKIEATMIILQIKEGENLEKSLKVFKKKFDRIGIVKELRVRKVYNKPSIVRRQKKLKAILRQKYLESQE
jgi:small subunit ribosomal protein S21